MGLILERIVKPMWCSQTIFEFGTKGEGLRYSPGTRGAFTTPQGAAQTEELRKNESSFLIAWSGLGVIVLLQGIALAASGFLPEARDLFLVKYLCPSFTPTVFLFVAGMVSYGVLKYLQNENSCSKD